MSDDRLRDLLKHRVEQAYETLHEAEILQAQQAYRGTINRAYYAMFYAVLAVLATRGLGSSKHSGAISLFDREFVKPGDFPKELSKSIHLALERRQQHDYGDFAELDAATAAKTVDDARVFLQGVSGYLAGKGFLGHPGDAGR